MKVVSSIFAILFGVIVLVGYFVEYPLLVAVRDALVQYAIILAGVALFIGVGNLVIVHWRKAATGQKGAGYSALLLLAFAVTVIIAGILGPTASWSLWIFEYIQVPVERTLLAILVGILAFASARLIRMRMGWSSIVYLLTVLVVLISSVPVLGIEIPGVYGPGGIRDLIVQIPALAGARGILIGVALGTIATGVRVLLGADRPYGG